MILREITMDDVMPNRHTYVRMTATSLWENLPLVLLSSLVFCLLCVPSGLLFLSGFSLPACAIGTLTVFPAWTGLLAEAAEIARDVRTDIRTMLKALPRFWVRSTGLGLIICFQPVVVFLTLPMLSGPEPSAVVWIGLAADTFGLLFLAALSVYAFPLLVLYDAGVAIALRNALILASRHINNTLGLLGMGVLFGLGIAYFSPGLLLVLPPVWGMFIVNNCRMVVEEELGPSMTKPR